MYVWECALVTLQEYCVLLLPGIVKTHVLDRASQDDGCCKAVK